MSWGNDNWSWDSGTRGVFDETKKGEIPARQRVALHLRYQPVVKSCRFVGNLGSYFCMIKHHGGGTTYIFVYFPGSSNIRSGFFLSSCSH